MLLGLLASALALAKDAPESKPKTFKENLELARKQMTEGQRKKAIEQLALAQGGTRSKSEQQMASNKRKLYGEQFLMAMSFQKYQEAKNLLQASRAQECLQELDAVGAGDFDNTLISKLRAECSKSLLQYEAAQKSFQQVLEYIPQDFDASLGLGEVYFEQKKYDQAHALLPLFQPKKNDEFEKYTLLKARVLFAQSKQTEATELLKEDIEKHLDHVKAIFELANMHMANAGGDWQARKYFLLFLSRCKRFDEVELEKRELGKSCEQAQVLIEKVNSKLGVK